MKPVTTQTLRRTGRGAALAALMLLATELLGGQRRAVAPAQPPSDLLSITFSAIAVAGSDSLLDLGTIHSNSSAGKAAASGAQRVGIRVGAGVTGGTARLTVALENPNPGCSVRIDGQPVRTVRHIVDLQAPLGRSVPHTVEIEVAPEVPEGSFQATLRWEAERN